MKAKWMKRVCGIVVLAALVSVATTVKAGAQQVTAVEIVMPVLAGATEIKGFLTPANADVNELMVEILQGSVLLHRVRITTFDRATGMFQATVPGLVKDQTLRVPGVGAAPQTTYTVAEPPKPAESPLQKPTLAPVSAGASIVSGWVTVADEITGVEVSVKLGGVVLDRAVTKAIDSDDGSFSVTLHTRVLPGQQVEAVAAAKSGQKSSAETTVTDPFNWGRVRAYFAAGVVLAQDRGEFSEQDLSLSFTLDKSWLQAPDYACLFASDPCKKKTNDDTATPVQARQEEIADSEDDDSPVPGGYWGPRGVNTFFNVRLTSLPVEATLPTEQMMGGEMEMMPAPTEPTAAESGVESFVASRKGATVEVGVYVPFFGKATSWMHQNSVNTLFLAPLVRGGIQTISNEPSLEATTFGADSVYRFWSVGIGLGHYKLSGTIGRAQELVSYLHVTRGRFEAFKIRPLDSETDLEEIGDPWRWAIEGRLKVPSTPFEIGFNANLGKGRDDVRFMVGSRFDVGELLGRLRSF